MNLPVKLLIGFLPKKVEGASPKQVNPKENTEEHLEEKTENRNPESSGNFRRNEKPITPPPTRTKGRQFEVELSPKEKEEKMKKICRADPKWIHLYKNFEKIRKNEVQINFITFLRGVLNPSEFREISEKCVADKSK